MKFSPFLVYTIATNSWGKGKQNSFNYHRTTTLKYLVENQWQFYQEIAHYPFEAVVNKNCR